MRHPLSEPRPGPDLDVTVRLTLTLLEVDKVPSLELEEHVEDASDLVAVIPFRDASVAEGCGLGLLVLLTLGPHVLLQQLQQTVRAPALGGLPTVVHLAWLVIVTAVTLLLYFELRYGITVCFVVVRADGPRTTTAVKDPILVLILVHIQ